MEVLEVQITSVHDRENLVAEIWLGETMLCEISNEKEQLKIEFFKGIIGEVDYYAFLKTLEDAKRELSKSN